MGNFKVAFKGLNVVPLGGKEVVGRCDKVWGRGVERLEQVQLKPYLRSCPKMSP